MKTLVFRGIVIVLLALATFMAVRETNKPDRPPATQGSLVNEGDPPAAVVEPPGGYKDGIQLFIYIFFIAITAGVIVLKWVIPAVGDRVAESFYSAPEKAEQTETQKAMAFVAQGEYHRALAAFGKISEDNPADRFAVVEMSKLYLDKLGDEESAVEVLEKAIAREWPEDDKCFLMMKLADLHSTARQDFTRARELLNQVIETFPGSRHAGNAHHKLREIEEQEFLAQRQSH